MRLRSLVTRWRRPAPAARRSERGFALVEALIAAAIICTMVVVYLQAAMTDANAERMVAERREAVLLARSALDSATVTGSDPRLASSGETDRLRWTVSLAPYGSNDPGSPPLEQTTVTVSDKALGRPLVTLTTLRLGR